MLLHRRGGGQARLRVSSRGGEQRMNWGKFAEASRLPRVSRWGARGVGGFWSWGATSGRGSCFLRGRGDVVPECLRRVEAVPLVGVLVGLEVRVAGFVVVWHGVWGCSDWSEEGSVSREHLGRRRRRQGWLGGG